MKKFLVPALSVICLIACNTTQNAKMIVGNWSGTEWLVDGKPSDNDAAGTSFQFKEDGNYTYNYAGTIESGLYKLDGDNLYTTPAGGQTIMVHIMRLTKDTLQFDMNRSGRAETLTLLRK
jgi:hypothetical protein